MYEYTHIQILTIRYLEWEGALIVMVIIVQLAFLAVVFDDPFNIR
jgi:hypothetical protein